MTDIDEDLAKIEAYFDSRADADWGGDGHIPNREMRLLALAQKIRAALRQRAARRKDQP